VGVRSHRDVRPQHSGAGVGRPQAAPASALWLEFSLPPEGKPRSAGCLNPERERGRPARRDRTLEPQRVPAEAHGLGIAEKTVVLQTLASFSAIEAAAIAYAMSVPTLMRRGVRILWPYPSVNAGSVLTQSRVVVKRFRQGLTVKRECQSHERTDVETTRTDAGRCAEPGPPPGGFGCRRS